VADIHLTPGGEWLYVSNRGHESLAVYAVDRHSGQLDGRGFVSTGGQVPRNFAIDPSGKFLLAANQNTGNLVLFRLDDAHGSPLPIGFEAAVPNPVCVIFIDL
jgi:6-phosphogluconolactonase